MYIDKEDLVLEETDLYKKSVKLDLHKNGVEVICDVYLVSLNSLPFLCVLVTSGVIMRDCLYVYIRGRFKYVGNTEDYLIWFSYKDEVEAVKGTTVTQHILNTNNLLARL